jgi:hypothetical protein
VSAQADENELLAIKEIALEKIDEAFMEIAANKEEFQEVLALAEDYLPENTMALLNDVIEVSQLDMGPEEKLDALLEASGTDCMTFAYIFLGAIIIDFIPIPVLGFFLNFILWPIEILSAIAFLLCLLGII